LDHTSLKACPLFSDLNEAQLDQVARYAKSVNYRLPEPLFYVGAQADAFFLIVGGKVRIDIPGDGDQPAKRVILRDGAFFGEIALVRDCLRTADAYVEKGTKLLRFDRSSFDELMSASPEIARKVVIAIQDRLGEYRAQEVELKEVSEPHALMFLSTGGREGASCLCANMAVKLHAFSEKPVLAADMNFGNQGMWRFLETFAKIGSYVDIFHCETITPETVVGCADKLACGVHLLSGFDEEMSDCLRPRHGGEIVTQGRKAFEYVLVDMGSRLDAVAAEVARRCDVIHIVCEPKEASIERADQMNTWLEEIGVGDRVRFILNRIPDDPEVPPEAIEQVLGEKFLGSVKYSRLLRYDGNHVSTPVVLAHPESSVAGELTRLCGTIIHQSTGPLEKIRNIVLWSLGLD
jgi:CRP-like cAMP-binding protein